MDGKYFFFFNCVSFQSFPCSIFILPYYKSNAPPASPTPPLTQQEQMHVGSELLFYILMQRNKVAPLESSHHNNTENRLIGMRGI